MEENERRPKRPRISAEGKAGDEMNESPRYEKVEYPTESRSAAADDGGAEGKAENENQQQGGYQSRYGQQQGYQPRGYQPRYGQQGGYQPRGYQQGGYQPRGYQQGGYQPRGYQQGGYQPRGYNPHYEQSAPQGEQGGEGAEGETQQPQQQQGGYQPRGYQRGYQGGYQQRGYQQRGYHQQGGYQQRGYGQQGGYQQRGYGQQGGYQPRGYGQQGGYDQQGGYQQGGYQQGGYRKPGRPMQRKPKGPKQQMRFTPRPKQIEYEEPAMDPNTEIRLNKFLANAGICSRREADELIVKGLVTVNGEVVSELGYKIKPQDVVEYDGKVVTSERKCYVLLNKPKDCVTTSDDPHGRKTVLDLVKGACEERIYPVGRLDRNTTGVLLLTNDGDLASKLTHPKYVKKKIYQVWTDKPISEEDMQRIADGVELDDGPIHADAVSYVNATDHKQAGIEIHSGRNRVVRRIFEHLGYHVVKLDRVYFAGLTKKNLGRGRWRYLTQEEVNFLRQGSFE
ncbi:MAG: RNA-binding S4 domain-containing protein [Muribaculaceae bacterium]|nr:RNA-binding S4 domain-containing protein [Muribaculaceae bacterium]